MSLAKAVTMAPAGATIELQAGTYSTAGLTIDRPLTLRAAPGAAVDLAASTKIPADQFEPAGHYWRTPWTAATVTETKAHETKLPASAPGTVAMRSVEITRMTGPQQALAVDGQSLHAATSLAAMGPGTFYIDADTKYLYVAQDPALHPVTTASADIGVLVAGPNVNVIGISIHGFATIGLRIGGSYATIQYTNLNYNGQIGLDINGVSHVTVQHCSMTHNGEVGIEISWSNNLTIQYNNVSNNNTGNYNVSYAAAGMKGTDVSYVTVRGNWVADNNSNAIWFDVNSTHITIVANQVLRNRCYAIYFELTDGPLVVGNVVYNNVQAGIGIHFTTNARLYNNTMVNNGTDMDVSASYNRSPYDTYHATIVNNIFWNAGHLQLNLYRYNGCNSYVYTEVDYNAYYRSNGGSPQYVVNWCNHWYSNISYFHATGNENHGIERDGGSDPYFVNVGSGDYHLRWGSPLIGKGQGIPSDAAAALGVPAWTTINIGALQQPGL
jgi:parallel beta-helix repeat protein